MVDKVSVVIVAAVQTAFAFLDREGSMDSGFARLGAGAMPVTPEKFDDFIRQPHDKPIKVMEKVGGRAH